MFRFCARSFGTLLAKDTWVKSGRLQWLGNSVGIIGVNTVHAWLEITTDVHNWCSENFSKIELRTSLDSLKNSASFDIWLD